MTNLLRRSFGTEREASRRQNPARLPWGLPTLLVLLAGLAGGVSAAENGGELYARVQPTSLSILVDDHLNGSGNMVSADGLVLTATHVIGRPGVRVEVLSPVAGRCKAEVVAVDLGHDLLLLRAELSEGNHPFLPLAEALPPPGEEVYLVGTPIFRPSVMFRGTMARETLTFEHLNPGYVGVLSLAATVPSGTSGGVWVDRHGGLIGVQSGIMSNNKIPVGVAFAGPLSAVKRLLETRQNASTPNLGVAVEEIWQQGRDILDRFPPQTEGLVVKGLQADGPAARGGLKQFDLLVACEGQPVRLTDELLRLVRQKQPGEAMNLTVLGPDGTGRRQVAVTLGHLEIGWPPSAADGKAQ